MKGTKGLIRLNFSISQLSEAQEKAKIKTSQGLVFQILEVTLPKTKAKNLQKVPNGGIELSVQNYNVSEGSLKLFNAQNHFQWGYFFYQNLRSQGHSYNILFHKHSKTK